MSKSTGKGKLEKFAELGQMPHVFQNFDYKQPQLLSANGPIDLKGKWNELVFKNGKPIVLELACGRGEYSVSLGQQFPENNYIGIDIKGNRMWTGAQHSLKLGLTNVAFLRTRIELLERFFAPGEVDAIWITFPDPHLREGRAKNRLTSPKFLALYRKLTKPTALVHLKTDEPILHQYTIEVCEQEGLPILERNDDVYQHGKPEGPLGIKTYYEGLNISGSNKSMYLQFVLHGKEGI